MLEIRSEQFEILERASRQRFENAMVEHASAFLPQLAGVIGQEQLRIAVRQAIERARGFGFTRRGPIRLYVELALLRGSDFDSDPQYAELGRLLREDGDEMARAERLHEAVSDYMDRVSGPDGVNVWRALEAVAAFARAPVSFSTASFEAQMLYAMERAFPAKVAYVGRPALEALIREGREAARRLDFTTPRAEALLVVLMFAFGHGCLADPLYPWISQTLTDPRIVDQAARAERLERKALTWLDHVLSRRSGGEVR